MAYCDKSSAGRLFFVIVVVEGFPARTGESRGFKAGKKSSTTADGKSRLTIFIDLTAIDDENSPTISFCFVCLFNFRLLLISSIFRPHIITTNPTSDISR